MNGIIGFDYKSNNITKRYYFNKNIYNDIIEIYDSDNNLVGKYEYDAYGNHKIITNIDNIANVNPIRYRGYYYDKETNLYYLESRYYDPEVARFISMDSIEYLEPDNINGLNLYCYCGCNPVMRVDPSGHIAFFIVTAIIGAVIGGIVAGSIAYSKGECGWALFGWIGLRIVGGALLGALGGMGISAALTGGFFSSVAAVKTGFILTYQMLKYGGGYAAGHMILDNLYSAFHQNQHVFWSGGDVAKDRAIEFAQSNGGMTLEMTGLGGYLETYYSGDYFNPILWDIASKNFANQVGYGETVRAILYYPNMRETAIWFTEQLILLKNNVEIIIGGL